MKERVFIKGVGVISALGRSGQEISTHLNAGRSAIAHREFKGEALVVAPLSETDEKAVQELAQSNKHYRNLDRTVLLSIFTTRDALSQSGWSDLEDLCINIGSSRGATSLFEGYHQAFLERDEWSRGSPLVSPLTTLGNVSSWVAEDLQAESAAFFSHSVTCSTTAQSLANGLAWLRSGEASRFVAGGSEAALTAFTLSQLISLRIYTKGEINGYYCRPCSKDGAPSFVLGEGAASFTLDREQHGALAELCAVGLARETLTSATSIDSEGRGFAQAMRQALKQAQQHRVDLVVLHAPGNPLGDQAELRAIESVFGDNLPQLCSNKWGLGHTLGASAGLGLDMALSAIKNGEAPAFPYPINFTTHARSDRGIRSVMINSAGFGGNFASIIIKAT